MNAFTILSPRPPRTPSAAITDTAVHSHHAMSPDKYARLFDQLRALANRKYRGSSTRIDFEKPRGRDRDRVVFASRPFNDDRPDPGAINDALKRCRLRPLERWKPLSRDAAASHLASALGYSLLYRDIELLPPADARAIAAGLLDLLPSARCYTNGLFPPPKPKPYSTIYAETGFPSITESLTDTGIVLIDDLHVALVWVQEDD